MATKKKTKNAKKKSMTPADKVRAVKKVIKAYDSRLSKKTATKAPRKTAKLSPQQKAYNERFPGTMFLPPPPDYVRPSDEAIEKAADDQREYMRLRTEMAHVRKSMVEKLSYDPLAELQTLVKEALDHLTTGMTPEGQEEFRKRATKVLAETGVD